MPTDLDLEDLEITDEQADHPLVKQLRAVADRREKTAKEATERAEKAERALALRDSGIDLTTTIGKLFAENYKGEATVEKIREAAAAYEGLLPPEPVNEDTATAERVAAASRGTDAVDDKGQLDEAWVKRTYKTDPDAVEQARKDGRLNKLQGIEP